MLLNSIKKNLKISYTNLLKYATIHFVEEQLTLNHLIT